MIGKVRAGLAWNLGLAQRNEDSRKRQRVVVLEWHFGTLACLPRRHSESSLA